MARLELVDTTPSPQRPKQYDDWEDWESDSDTETRDAKTYQAKGGIIIALTPDTPSQLPGVAYPGTVTTAVSSQTRQSIQKIRRLRSRQRQKAQNARAGIKVVTDMSQLQPQHKQLRPHYAQGKFVDAAALRALEGEPNSASVGSWNWLMRRSPKKYGHSRKPSVKSIKTPITANTDLSPNPAPITIGISLPSEQVSDREISPKTTTLETPIDIARYLPQSRHNTNTGNEPPQKSVWSPDTPSTVFDSPGRSSSIYSQGTSIGPLHMLDNVPPVPMVPETFRNQQTVADQAKSPEAETPYTPFEEDTLSPLSAATAKSPATATTGTQGIYRSGWWDHITSPFVPSPKSPGGEQSYNAFKVFASSSTQLQQTQRAATKNVASASECWSGNDKKKAVPAPLTSPVHIMPTVPSIHTVSPILPPNEKGKSTIQTQPTSGSTSANTRVLISSSPPSTPSIRSVSPASTSGSIGGTSSTGSMSNNPFLKQVDSRGQQQPQTQSEKARILQEENAASETGFQEHPPPYSYNPPPSGPVATAKYAAAAPPSLNLNPQPLPSPGMVSPAMTGTMTSQGAIGLREVALTPPPPGITIAGAGPVPDLPNCPPGFFVPGDHFQDARGSLNKVERQRRRHEKEDAVARRVGGFWRGRGCIPESGCYGRAGREGRKKRRIICLLIVASLILLIVLSISLPLTLMNRSAATETEVNSIWLNLTDFPPMPTGILTVAGPDKKAEVNGCVNPPTMWSCYLPKEDNDDVAPFNRDQPKIIFQVQFDNSSTREWDTPQGVPPTSLPGSPAIEAGDGLDGVLSKINQTETTRNVAASDGAQNSPKDVLEKGGLGGLAKKFFGGVSRFVARVNPGYQSAVIEKRANKPLFTPSPEVPSFQEMWFLGNTTDGIVDDNKAGEPTPFYITILSGLNETVGPNVLAKRDGNLSDSNLNQIGDQIGKLQNQTDDSNAGLGTGVTVNLTGVLPPPELNPDGTGKKARMLPQPIQQPVRLFDRGLPSEHYGFYTYFNRTIYLKSTDTVPDSNRELVQDDLEGGSLEVNAKRLVTFTQTRFFVKIWTKQSNATQLVNADVQQPDGRAVAPSEALTSAPGTFPYPITFGTDLHGGNRTMKTAWFYRVDDDQHINRTDPKLILRNIGFGGTWINPGGSENASLTMGGFDGGTGGCKCVWKNFKSLN